MSTEVTDLKTLVTYLKTLLALKNEEIVGCHDIIDSYRGLVESLKTQLQVKGEKRKLSFVSHKVDAGTEDAIKFMNKLSEGAI